MKVELTKGTVINGYYVIKMSDLVLELTGNGQIEELKKMLEKTESARWIT